MAGPDKRCANCRRLRCAIIQRAVAHYDVPCSAGALQRLRAGRNRVSWRPDAPGLQYRSSRRFETPKMLRNHVALHSCHLKNLRCAWCGLAALPLQSNTCILDIQRKIVCVYFGGAAFLNDKIHQSAPNTNTPNEAMHFRTVAAPAAISTHTDAWCRALIKRQQVSIYLYCYLVIVVSNDQFGAFCQPFTLF